MGEQRFDLDCDGESNLAEIISGTDLLAPATCSESNVVYTRLRPMDDIQHTDTYAGIETALNFSFWEHAFIRFDLTGFSVGVRKATLRLYNNQNSELVATLLGATSDDWNDTSSFLPEQTVFPTNEDQSRVITQFELDYVGYLEIDVTSYVQMEKEKDGLVSFELMHEQDKYHSIDSKEGHNPPELLIEYD